MTMIKPSFTDYQWIDEHYQGKPWLAYATGPSHYDCRGLVVDVARRFYGFDADLYAEVESGNPRAIHAAIEQEKQTGQWAQIGRPIDGCIVLLSQSQVIHHMGIFVGANGGRVLNAREGFGVCLDGLRQIKALGFQRVEFWVPVQPQQ